MISFIGNRPALQIGLHQVFDYDTSWLEEALRRAARAADQEDFTLVSEIRAGIELYLENQCKLKMLPLGALFEKMQKMLVKIGCNRIAENIKPLAPPLTISLVLVAQNAGNGFELAFFQAMREELNQLRELGAEDIRFTGMRECTMILRGNRKWNYECEQLLTEIREFLADYDLDFPRD